MRSMQTTASAMIRTATSIAYAIVPFGLLCAAASVVAMPLARDDMIALGILVLAPVALIGAYVVAQGIIGNRIAGAVMAVIYIFIIGAIFRTRAYDDKSIDLQVALKLAAFGVIFVTTLVFFSFALGRIRLPRLFYIWLVFFVALIMTSLYAVNVIFALTCTTLSLIAYLYSVYMTVWLSRLTAVQIMMWTSLLLCLGSIFVYYAVPSIGVMQGWTPESGFGEIGRMKGITGSANGIGLVAAIGLVLSILYFRSFSLFGKCTALALIPSAGACLVLSNNRSSMIGIAAALWFSFVSRRNVSFKVMLTITLGVIGVAALAFFSDEIFVALSRSGKVDEITSATGRAAIWSVVLQMWAKQPLHGYGYASALAILPNDPRLFHAAAHAHNMYLELLFAGGVILLALFLYALWQTLLQALRLREINEAALLIFFLLRGLTEATPFSGMASFSSFAFSLTLALIFAPLARPYAAHAVSAAGAVRKPDRAPRLSRA
jgi:O-antigen ligase